MKRKPLSTTLVELRTKHGLTQAELAERSGVTKRTIEDVEQGRSEDPKCATLAALATALGITMQELWFGTRRK
jgi:transcriptional regulator with XRE-family HTH domain